MEKTRKTAYLPNVRVAPEVRATYERLADQNGEKLTKLVHRVLIDYARKHKSKE